MRQWQVETERVETLEGRLLCCPWCGTREYPYLHHHAITVYDRGEDAEQTLVTRVSHKTTEASIMPSKGSGNPSMRRDGIAIEFSCELCSGVSELTIAQHKGQTELSWRAVMAKREKELA